MPTDLIAQLDPDTGHVWIGSPDGLSVPVPLFRHLTALGGVYVRTRPHTLRFSRPTGVQALDWLRDHGYGVETATGSTPAVAGRPRVLECETCAQPFRQAHASQLASCTACGATPLVLVSPAGG